MFRPSLTVWMLYNGCQWSAAIAAGAENSVLNKSGQLRGVINLATVDTGVIVMILVTAWIFLAPIGNGRPIFNSSVIMTFPLVLFLLPLRYAAGYPIGHLKGSSVLLLLSFSCWAFAALFSAIASEQGFQVAGLNFLSGFLIPLLVFASFLNLPISERFEKLIWAGLSLGVIVVFGRATLAYYASWGIPSAVELLTSRYNLEKMGPYMDVTYGNTGSTAEILVLVSPGLALMALSAGSKGAWRLLYGAATILCIINFLIVQSRAAFLVAFLILVYTMLAARVRIYKIVLFLSGLATAILVPFLSDLSQLLTRFGDAIFLRAAADNAISERVESIEIGWRLFVDNVFFGVGPNLSQAYNRHFNAHQVWVDQASELGVFGLLPLMVLTVAVFGLMLWYSIPGPAVAESWRRFRFVIGPASFILYGMISNFSWSLTTVNVWAILFAALLGCSTGTLAQANESRLTNMSPDIR
jgi:hypothetical protein